jgi:hypothetical protein
MGQHIVKTDKVFSKVLLILSLSIAISSCIKDTRCKGDIFVVRNDNGQPVVGAKVWSHYGKVSDVQNTDQTGRVHLDRDLPAILTIDAYKPAVYPNPQVLADSASATLKLEAGTTNSVKIVL